MSKSSLLTKPVVIVQDLLYLYRRNVKPVKRSLETRARRLIPWVIAVALSLGLAQAILTQSPAKVIGLFVLPVLLWLVFAHTDIAMLVIVGLVASFVDESNIPRAFEVGGMGFYLSELLVIVTLFAVFIKVHITRGKDSYIHSPMTLPIILLMVSVGFAIVVSYVNWLAKPAGSFNFRTVYNCARPMIYVLLFFITAYSLDNERKLRRVIGILLLLSVILSVMLIAQHVIGYDRPIFSKYWYRGSGDNPGEVAGVESSRLRVEAPGLHMMMALALVALIFSAMYKMKRGVWYLILLGVMGIALVLTWERNYWIAVFLGSLTIGMLSPHKVKLKLLATWGVAVVLITVSFTGLAVISSDTRLAKDISTRITSIFSVDETMRTGTIEARFHENQQAIKAIKRSPIFGIGAGNPILYGDVYVLGRGSFFVPQYYMHNSYLMLYIVYGLLGIVSFIWLIVAFMLRMRALLRMIHSVYLFAIVVSFSGALVGMLFRAVWGPLFNSSAGVAFLAFICGALEACWQINANQIKAQSIKRNLNACDGQSLPSCSAKVALMTKQQGNL